MLSSGLKYCSCSLYNRVFRGLCAIRLLFFGSVSIFSRELLSGVRLATLCLESIIRFFFTELLKQSLIESLFLKKILFVKEFKNII